MTNPGEIERIRSLIARGETDAATKEIIALTRAGDREFHNEALLQARRLADLEKRIRKGVVTDESAAASSQKISEALLSMLDQIEARSLPTSPLSIPQTQPSPPGDSVSASPRPDLFISHASEDKGTVAEPLARILSRLGCVVWYDSFQLTLGDSLREEIDKGLRNCRYGVVILSPQFFAKNWPRRELNALLALEDADAKKRILPVWHNVDQKAIALESPLLADRLGVSTKAGLEQVAHQILQVVRPT
jgi:hypothetical protein